MAVGGAGVAVKRPIGWLIRWNGMGVKGWGLRDGRMMEGREEGEQIDRTGQVLCCFSELRFRFERNSSFDPSIQVRSRNIQDGIR